MHKAPDFIIAGTQKGGTTSVYKSLIQHPDILEAEKKEIHFFSTYYNKGVDWYLEHFPERPENKKCGEASPFYLFHPKSAERIHAVFPHIKIIILLRNPAHRAISHYHQQFRREHESLPMMEAFKAEAERVDAAFRRIEEGKQQSGANVQKFSYLSRGHYLEQLQRYESRFPPEQLYIGCSETYFRDPYGELERIYSFIGVTPDFRPADLLPRKPGNYGDVPTEVMAFLDDYFSDRNEALFQHLGYRLDWQA
jgi:hypothetical protein